MELNYQNNSKSLFRKYAFLITSLAKHQVFRDYVMDKTFSMPKGVDLLLPNGYIEKLDKKQRRLTVTTRAVYAPKLYPALYTLDLANNWLGGFGEAQRFLLGSLGLIRDREFLPLLLKLPLFTVATFNPNAHPETTSVDGYAVRTATEVWATIRAGAGTSASDLDTNLICQYATGTSPNWSAFYRIFTLFDTSSLGNGAVISGATQSFYTVTDGNFAVSLRIVTTTPASNTAIVAADYSQQGTVAQATDRTTASMSLNAYNDWTLNSTGIGNISLTGITKFGLRVAGDADNVEPTPGNGLISNMREHHSTEGVNKTKLVVTYTLGKTFNETIVPAESFNKAITKNFSDSSTLSDIVSVSKQFLKSFSDIVNFSDTINKAGARIFSDLSTISGTIEKSIIKALGEPSITLSDTLSTVKGRSVFDIIALSEYVRKLKNGVSVVWTKVTRATGTWIKRSKT